MAETQETQGIDSAVEDAIFGTGNTVEDKAFAPKQEAPQEGQPNVAESVEAVAEKLGPIDKIDNDQVRYNYWQSQADKSNNELKETKARNDELQQQLIGALQQNQGQQVTQEETQEAQPEFPPPPDKPVKPRDFNREEAFTDPTSESARYMDNVDDWRDNMDDYNRLYVEYQSAVVQAEHEEMQKAETDRKAQRQQVEDMRRQMDDVGNYLSEKHQVTSEQVSDFVTKMSDPNNLTIDNLWRLYQLEYGQQANPNAPNPVPGRPQGGPSPEFEQTKRAQSVPNPMGVMPSSNEATSRSSADSIMDDMISDLNKRNPF
tara:strand:+ start:5998 stop:6948 length:951 start_codon:yes stop_codon:yes gene_type:complete